MKKQTWSFRILGSFGVFAPLMLFILETRFITGAAYEAPRNGFYEFVQVFCTHGDWPERDQLSETLRTSSLRFRIENSRLHWIYELSEECQVQVEYRLRPASENIIYLNHRETRCSLSCQPEDCQTLAHAVQSWRFRNLEKAVHLIDEEEILFRNFCSDPRGRIAFEAFQSESFL